MEPNSNEPHLWEKEWTIDDIRNYSANWNLAGDAGLLNQLQTLSQSLLSKGREVIKDIDSLCDETKATDLRIRAAINEFLMLSNTQFVENRVYDDEVPEPNTSEKEKTEEPKSKEAKEAVVVQQISDALRLGFQVLNTAFEKHEVVDSESEEDEEGNRTFRTLPVLRKKNPYLHRPLPYVIGSEKFTQDDKVGLGESVSEEESSEESEKEDIKDDEFKRKLSEDSIEEADSEVNSLYKKTNDRNVHNFDPQKQQLADNSSKESDDEGDLFGPEPVSPKDRFSSGSESDVSESEQEAEIVNGRATFAAELAAKLSATQQRLSVAAPLQEEEEEEEAESSDTHIHEKQKRSHSVRKGSGHKENVERKSSIRKNSKSSQNKVPVIPAENYDDDDDDEDSLFKPKSGLFTGGGGLFDDLNDDDGLFGDEPKSIIKESVDRKKSKSNPAATDKKISDSSTLFGESDDLLDPFDKKSDKMSAENSAQNPVKSSNKKVSLFDDADDDDENDLFSSASSLSSKVSTQNENSSQKSKESSLFDKDDEKDDLFSEPSKSVLKEEAILPSSESTPKKKMPAGAVSLFGVNTNPLTAALKAQKALNNNEEDKPRRLSSSISAEPNREEDTKSAASNSPANKPDTGLFGDSSDKSKLFTDEKPISKPKKISLFDDDGDDDDDLFGSSGSAGNASRTSSISNTTAETEASSNVSNEPKNLQDDKPQKVAKEVVKAKPKEVSLFSEEDEDAGDLFASVLKPRADSKSKPATKLRTRSLFEDEDVLFGGKSEEAPTVNLFGSPNSSDVTDSSSHVEETRPRKKTGGSLFDTAEEDDDLFSTQADDSKSVGRPPVPTPRKASLPKEESVKSDDSSSAGGSKKKKPIGGVSLFGGLDPFANKLKSTKSADSHVTNSSPTPRRESLETSAPKETPELDSSSTINLNPLPSAIVSDAVTFDEPADASTLQTACKGRAKIQTKRRPQSRKARQALTKSGVFGDGDSNDETPRDTVDAASDKLKKNSTNGETNILSPSTEEEDVLPVDDLIVSKVTPPTVLGTGDHRRPTESKENVQAKSTEKKPTERPTSDLFDLGSDDDLFSSKPSKAASSLFSSKKDTKLLTSDDEDDLFANTKTNKPISQTAKLSSKTSSTEKNNTNKSIFDDDADDGFDFGSSKKTEESSTKKSKKSKTVSLFDDDDDDEDLFSDPLIANSK